ncbi:MAG: class IV adenylate cyclase [Bacteroidota bacterium]
MPRNLELKAPLSSSYAGAAIARSLGARRTNRFYHTDTYFNIPSGRLKLREFRGNSRSQLIWYIRPNTRGVRISQYAIAPVQDTRETRKILSRLFGVQVVVRKRRDLFILNNARIHLDRIAGLGNFVEFEVIVRYGIPQAKHLMNVLKTAFSVRQRDCIGTSYCTMLMNRTR